MDIKQQKYVTAVRRVWFTGFYGMDKGNSILSEVRQLIGLSDEEAKQLERIMINTFEDAVALLDVFSINGQVSDESRKELEKFCDGYEYLSTADIDAIVDIYSQRKALESEEDEEVAEEPEDLEDVETFDVYADADVIEAELEESEEPEEEPEFLDDSEEKKQCPYCAETILKSAVKCRHCHEFLDDSRSHHEEETKRCTFCGEEVLDVAIKCRFCGEFFDEVRGPAQRQLASLGELVLKALLGSDKVQEAFQKSKTPVAALLNELEAKVEHDELVPDYHADEVISDQGTSVTEADSSLAAAFEDTFEVSPDDEEQSKEELIEESLDALDDLKKRISAAQPQVPKEKVKGAYERSRMTEFRPPAPRRKRRVELKKVFAVIVVIIIFCYLFISSLDDKNRNTASSDKQGVGTPQTVEKPVGKQQSAVDSAKQISEQFEKLIKKDQKGKEQPDSKKDEQQKVEINEPSSKLNLDKKSKDIAVKETDSSIADSTIEAIKNELDKKNSDSQSKVVPVEKATAEKLETKLPAKKAGEVAEDKKETVDVKSLVPKKDQAFEEKPLEKVNASLLQAEREKAEELKKQLDEMKRLNDERKKELEVKQRELEALKESQAVKKVKDVIDKKSPAVDKKAVRKKLALDEKVEEKAKPSEKKDPSKSISGKSGVDSVIFDEETGQFISLEQFNANKKAAEKKELKKKVVAPEIELKKKRNADQKVKSSLKKKSVKEAKELEAKKKAKDEVIIREDIKRLYGN